MDSQFVSNEKLYARGDLFDAHYRLIRQLNDKTETVAIWLARDLDTVDKYASANDESTGKLVSMIICHPNTFLELEDEQRWQDEFDAAHDCHHPNLLPPETYTVLNETYYLVFPYTKAESLCQFIGKNMSDKVTWSFISDIASGLNELHTHQPRIVHNDIKPSNILVFDKEDFVLTNYGIHFEKDIQRINNHSSSIAYMAPERFHGSSTSRPESDIWSFGATLYEVLSGKKPFGDQGGKSQKQDTPMPPLHNQPAEIRDLIYACLQADPRQRPTAQQIMDIAHSKTFLTKKKKIKPDRTKGLSSNDIRKKKSITIAAIALLIIGVVFYLLIPHTDNDNSNEIGEKKDIPVINYYEEAVKLLSDKNTAKDGKRLLDSLVHAKDWQATFLLSRLCFDTKGNDTVFYDKRWEIMRDNCDIIPDNVMAHQYLFDAFELNDNDFMILYQLGRDFRAGDKRGCERNLEYALWCFDRAEKCLNSSNINRTRYLQELENGRNRISTLEHTPIRPSR